MLTVLVDDERTFKDGREHLVARGVEDALELLKSLGGRRIDELWLDHDLGEVDGVKVEVKEVIREVERASVWDEPYDIGVIVLHTTNPGVVDAIMLGLNRHHKTVRVAASDHLRVVEELRKTPDA
jgi:hypothetical protein